MADDDRTPIEQLFADEDDRPVQVTLPDDADILTKDFHDALGKLASAAHALDTLASDLSALRETGLRDEDLRDLLYGRNSTLSKGDIQSVTEALDAVLDAIEGGSEQNRRRLLVILVSHLASAKMSTTEKIFSELRALRSRYAG